MLSSFPQAALAAMMPKQQPEAASRGKEIRIPNGMTDKALLLRLPRWPLTTRLLNCLQRENICLLPFIPLSEKII